MPDNCTEWLITLLWLGDGAQSHWHRAIYSCVLPFTLGSLQISWPKAAGSKWWLSTMKSGIVAVIPCHWELLERILLACAYLHPDPLTSSAPLLHFADKDAQPMFRAATDAEAQFAIHALLHCDGIDDITLVAAGCGDRGADESHNAACEQWQGVSLLL